MSQVAVYPRALFVKLALAYCLFVAYVSTVIGPVGFHFVPISVSAAWRQFLATGFDRGLVQADLNSNLLMLVPLGFVTAGALCSRRPGPGRLWGALAALGFCVTFVLAVKFAQEFFPPRTVSLDYIYAQGAGSLLGVALFLVSPRPLALAREHLQRRGRTALTVVLVVYAAALLLFFLFPFDVVLTAGQLQRRLGGIPEVLLTLPGAGGPGPWKLLAPIVEIVETMPLGLLVGLHCQRRPLFVAATGGLAAMSAVCALQIVIQSASPHLASVLLHAAGIVFGAAAGGSLGQLTLIRWRLNLARAVPLLAIAYVLAVVFAKGLLTTHWRTPHEAWQALDPRGLMPFWNDYIVSKAHAAISTAAHVVLYAPIGVLVWLRRGTRSGGQGIAAVLAAVLAGAAEFGRWLRPGLQPDFSNIIIAVIAAAAAVPAAAFAWEVLEESFPTPGMPAMPRRPVLLTRAPQPVVRPRRGAGGYLRAAGAALCAMAIGAILHRYPLPAWPLAAGLGVYAVVLARWPVLWLVAVPAALPALDLTPWTGWLYIGESDLVILASVAVLLLRAPPGRADLGLDRLSAAAVLLAAFVYLLSIALGLAVPASPTDNPYLSPWNALRVAKGFGAALLLLPFLAREVRQRADALAWFGAGMLGGLALVSAAAIAERLAFVGLFDFTTDYRIVATFSSMHFGGGMIGGFLALALPFLVLCAARARRWLVPGVLLSAAALYTLVVTYARTAYAVAVIGTATACLGWAIAAYRRSGRRSALLAPLSVGGAFAVAIGAFAFDTGYMHYRLEHIAGGLSGREQNWADGLGVRDDGLAASLIGMGLGTYPRLYRARTAAGPVASNFRVRRQGGRVWLSLTAGAPGFYFGQKVPARTTGDYTIAFDFRTPAAGGSVSAILCEKLLLYSQNCASATFTATASGLWSHERAALPMTRLSQPHLLGLLAPPVELAFHIGKPGDTAEIAAVRLYDPAHRQLIRNGDFANGTANWYATDDDHLVWRMKDQFLMLLFEQGTLGLWSYLFLTAAALFGTWRALRRGDSTAAPLAGALAAYFGAGIFDYLLEAPRLATLFYLICFAAMLASRGRLPATLPRDTARRPPGGEPAGDAAAAG